MTKIEAIIRPERVSVVVKALGRAGYHGVTVMDVTGHGAQKGIAQVYRGDRFQVDMLPKALLILVVPDGKRGRVVKAIVGAAKSGKIGDGKIFISRVADAIRVRTGQRGAKAI